MSTEPKSTARRDKTDEWDARKPVTELKLGTCCPHPKEDHFSCAMGSFCKSCSLDVWEHVRREGESAAAQPCIDCGHPESDKAHDPDCPSIIDRHKFEAVPPAAETARDESWRNIPVGHWFFQDLQDCTDRYHVMERTTGGSVLVCSTPWHHELAERTMKGIVELHNATATAQVKAETAMTAEQFVAARLERDPNEPDADVWLLRFPNGIEAVENREFWIKHLGQLLDLWAAHVREAAQWEIDEKNTLLAAIAIQVNQMAAVDGTSPVSEPKMIPSAIRSLQASYTAAARARNGEAGRLLKLQAAKHKKDLEAADRKLAELEKALCGLLAVTEKRGDAAKFLAVGKAEAVLASLRAESKEPV